MNIYILGSLNTDNAIHTNRIPKAGETVYGYDFIKDSGGKGANQAVSAAKQGAQTHLIGAVGKDLNGIQLVDAVRTYGVDVHHVHVVDAVTGCATLFLNGTDHRKILNAGANHKVSPRFIDSGLKDAEKGDLFITQLETNLPAIGYGILKAKEKKMKIILNAAPSIEFPRELLNDVDILIVNELECKALFEVTDISINTLKNLFPGVLIVTVGAKGLFFVENKEVRFYEGLKVNVIDTTGASDALIGAFASQLDKGYDYALRYAVIAAGLTCLKEGAQQSIPNKSEVEAKMAELISLE